MDKVFFRLAKDSDGYPPFEVESVWAKKVSEGLYQIDNIPWYTYDATVDDVVRTLNDEGNQYFAEVHVPSGNSLLRVLVLQGFDPKPLRCALRDLGCHNELADMGQIAMLAVNVPRDVPLAKVRAILDAGLSEGTLEYEEAILRQ